MLRMPILKRILVWTLERGTEALLLGTLFALLLHVSLRLFWVYALGALVLLFLHGYYFTTAFFGVVWRSARDWVYPAIAATLLIGHGLLICLRLKDDVTPEARAIAVPFLLAGACLTFVCSLAGGALLSKWDKMTSIANPFLSAFVLTVFGFTLANIFWRVRYSEAFRPDGIPFSFYREGGFSDGYHWRDGVLLWRGVLGDTVFLICTSALLARVWRWFDRRLRRSPIQSHSVPSPGSR